MKRPTLSQLSKRARHYIEERDEMIELYGRFLQAVAGDEEAPSFTYTIGNWQKHHLPELLILHNIKGCYLNELSEMMIARGQPFQNGEIVATGELLNMSNKKFRARIVDAAAKRDF
jgi:hypothetical protein